MNSHSFNLQPLDIFSSYRFIRPPVSDGAHLLGVQTDGTVVALDRSARVMWRRPTTRPWPPMTSRVNAAVRGGALLVSDKEWTALELATGSVRWHREIESDLAGPAFDDKHVWAYCVDAPYRAHESSLIEVSLIDGSTRSLRKAVSWGEVLAVTHEAVIALEGNRLIGVDRASGAERWSLGLERPSCEHGRKRAVVRPYAHRQERKLIVPLIGYGFVAIDLYTGALVWDADLQIVGMASVIAGERLHVQSTWRFLELDAATGAVLSDVEIANSAERRKLSAPGPLVYHEGVLYAANRDGTVFGWDTSARRLVWSHPLGTRVEWSCPPQVLLNALWIMDAEGALHQFSFNDEI